MKLYGIQFKGRYSSFDSDHTAVSRQLFKSVEEAEDYIPTYRAHMIEQCKTLHQGFYTLDEEVPMKLVVIDFEIDL